MSKSAAALRIEQAPHRDPSPSGVVLRSDALCVELTPFGEAHLYADLDGAVAGIFVPTYRPLPVGASVRVAIDLDEREIEVRGVVRFVRDASDESSPGVGVAFDAIDDEAKDALERYAEIVPPWFYD
jgi:hypothetical protein